MPLSDDEFNALIAGTPQAAKPAGALPDSEFDALVTGAKPAAVAAPAAPQPSTSAFDPAKLFMAQTPWLETGMRAAAGDPLPNKAATAFLTGVYESFGGLKQMGTDVLESVGILPKGASDRLRVMTDADIDELNGQLERDLGPVSFTLANIGGKMIPAFALPTGPAGAGLMAGLARIFTGAASGAVFGAAESSDKPIEQRMEDRASGAKSGAVLGAVAAGVIEPVNMLRGAAGDLLRGGLKTQTAEEGLKLDKALRDMTGGEVGLKLSQITGDPAFEAIESGARSAFSVERIARDMEQRQQKAVWSSFRKLMDDILAGGKPFGQQTQDAFSSTVDALAAHRRTQAAGDFGAIKSALGDAADQPVIPVESFRTALKSMLDSIPDRGTSKAQEQLRAQLATMLGQFSEKTSRQMAGLSGMVDVQTGSRAATVSELQSLLSLWGDAASGKGAAFKDILDATASRSVSAKLFGALMDDLDTAAQSGQRGAELLKVARDNYRANSEPLQALRETALGRFLGETDVPKTPMELEKYLSGLEPDQLMNGLRLIERADPAIHKGLQRFWLERAVRKVNEPKQMAEFSTLNQRKMLDLLDPDGKFDAIYTDPAIRERILTNLALVGRINRNAYQQGRRLMPYLKESAGIMASRSPTFAARWASEIFTPRIMARYIDSAEGMKALEQLAQPYNANKWAAAMGTLKNIAYPAGEPEE